MDRPGLPFFFIKGGPNSPNLRPSLFFFLFTATWTALITFVLKLKRIRCRFVSIKSYWNRIMRSLFGTVLLSSLLAFSSVSWAETTPDAELEGILQKIESRHYRWIAIRANVLLFFAKGEDSSAMCGGELLYQRLDERMFLTCADAQQKLVFIFRTFDRRFDLYLPSQNTVYHGSIFDMEDSPDIESHLKARDLYRALKPMAVDPRRAKVERANSAITSLDVYGRNSTEGMLARKLYLTPEGDVRGELFYNSEGKPVTEIQRYDFQEIRGRAGSYTSIIFPKKVTITSPETKKGSAIFFTRVTALDAVDPLEFILRVPDRTREVFLNEKDPRFAGLSSPKRPKETETVPASDSSQFKNTEVVPRLKSEKIPVKKAPSPQQDKKSAPKSKEPSSLPVKDPPAIVAPEDADADIAVEEQPPADPSSLSDAQTTLDPSVEPSLEMEKR